MKRISVLLILLILFMPVSLVFAQNIDVSVTAPKSVYAGETTEFEVSIQNNGVSDWFSLSVFGKHPEWLTLKNSNLYIESGKKATTKVWVSTSKNALQATYKYDIIVSRASDNSKTEKHVLVSVMQKSAVVITSVNADCMSCKPGQDVSVSATVKNVGSKTLTGLKLYFEFMGTTRVVDIGTLEPGSEKTIIANFLINKMANPGNYNLYLRLKKLNKLLDNKTLQFSVKGFSDIVSVEREDNNLFGRHVTIEVANKGNIEADYQVTSHCLPAWYEIYTGSEHKILNNQCLWTGSIGAHERKVIEYSEIYWTSILALFVLIFLVAYFYLGTADLVIKKKMMHKRPVVEGKKYSVSIEVANKGKSVENIVVRDKVPSMFEVEKSFETIKPVVKKTEKGTELVWKVGRLKPGEIRILHYKVKTLIGLIGTYKLPPAKLTGKLDGKSIARKSNTVEIHGPKIR